MERLIQANGQAHYGIFTDAPKRINYRDFDRDQPLQPWHIDAHDGQVQLRFEARGLHRERLNLGFLASNFKQIFGRFSGVLRPIGRPDWPSITSGASSRTSM